MLTFCGHETYKTDGTVTQEIKSRGMEANDD